MYRQSIARGWLHLITSAQKFIYIENQYFLYVDWVVGLHAKRLLRCAGILSSIPYRMFSSTSEKVLVDSDAKFLSFGR